MVIPASTVYVDLSSLDDLLHLDRKLPRDDSNEVTRKPFIHFLKGLLQLDPSERWTASQALLHPFITEGPLKEFVPIKSEKYLETPLKRTSPSGNFRESCPQILQSIRGSQDMSVNVKDVCFRPLVEELKDEFFTGFAHGKLMQVPKPTVQQAPAPTNWQNPFMNFPMNLEPNLNSRPLPDIVGPRYQRPHSYEEHQNITRPFSPKIQRGVHNYRKYKNMNKKTCNFTSVLTESHRPGSNDEKKKVGEKHYKYKELMAITQMTIEAKTVSSMGFLRKVQQEAHGSNKPDN